MKYLPTIAGALLGLIFIATGLMFFLNLMPKSPPPPVGSPVALFMGALMPTGYMNFVKVVEVLGGLFVAIPRTRNLGLLFLGPVIINILAFHIFLTTGAGLMDPKLIVICLLAVYLLWVERKPFASLVCRS